MSNLNLIYDNDQIYNDPLAFIDAIDRSKHFVLFYKNREFGQKIQFRFIRNGLLKGENCIYTTHDNDILLIEIEMMNNGINVEEFNKKGLLHIYKIPDLLKHPKGVIKGAEEFLNMIFSGLKTPFRLVARLIDEIKSEEQIEANLALEKIYHSSIDKFHGLLLCPYDVNKNPINTQGIWAENILKNHHSAIFVTQPSEGAGIAFDID